MSDLVEQLRNPTGNYPIKLRNVKLRNEAADEIERLRAELENESESHKMTLNRESLLQAENERLRAVVDGLQKFVDLQAEDEGLWFIAQTAPEAYVQRGLRGCHQYIEEQLAALETDHE